MDGGDGVGEGGTEKLGMGSQKKRDRVGLWVGGGLGGFLCNVVNGRDCHDSIQELPFLGKVDWIESYQF